MFLFVPIASWAAAAPADVVPGVTPLQVQEAGAFKLPAGFRNAAWIDVMSGVHLLPEATERLRSALQGQGFVFAASEATANASVIITGHVQLHNNNPDKPYDSGKVFLGEIIEARAHSGDKRFNRAATRGRNALDYDAGVAQQGQRLLTQAGVPGGFLAGIAFAIVTDWLVDKSGVRTPSAEVNDPSATAQPAPPPEKEVSIAVADPVPFKFKARPWFCDEACKRTVHVAQVTASVWQGQTQLSSYAITLTKELPDMDESSMRSLIDAGLGRTIEKLLEASAQ